MSKVTVTGTVDASREDVWELLTDLDRLAAASALTGSVADRSGDRLVEGTTWQTRSRFGSIDLDADWEVTAREEPYRLVSHGRTPIGEGTVAWYLSSVDGRTRCKQVTVYELEPDLGPVTDFLDWALVHRLVAVAGIQTVENLRHAAESATGGRKIPIE